MASPLRVAFVGLDHPHGAAWRESLAQLTDQIQIVALVPGLEGGTTSLEERYVHLPRYATVGELLAGADFHAAIVCLSNRATPAAVTELAQAGKGVLVEKPIAGSAAEATAALREVDRSGVAFQAGYLWRYDEGANRLREMVADGRFGKLIHVDMRFTTREARRRGAEHYLFDPDQSGAGFFNWLACHWLDLLLYITGDTVVGVTARVGNFADAPLAVEDGGVALLELSRGGLASFTGGYWLPRWFNDSGWIMRGSQRWVEWDPTASGTGGLLKIHGPQPHWHPMEERFAVPAQSTPGYGGARGVDLLRDWLRTVQGGPACRNTTRSVQAVLELLDAIYTSSREGRRLACQIG